MNGPTVSDAIEAKRTLELCIDKMLKEFEENFGVHVRHIHIQSSPGEQPVTLAVEIKGLTA